MLTVALEHTHCLSPQHPYSDLDLCLPCGPRSGLWPQTALSGNFTLDRRETILKESGSKSAAAGAPCFLGAGVSWKFLWVAFSFRLGDIPCPLGF